MRSATTSRHTKTQPPGLAASKCYAAIPLPRGLSQVTGVNSQINKHRVARSCKEEKKNTKVLLPNWKVCAGERDDGEKREVGSLSCFPWYLSGNRAGLSAFAFGDHGQADLRTDDDWKNWRERVSRFAVSGKERAEHVKKRYGKKKKEKAQFDARLSLCSSVWSVAF